jgi:hypothetical protein
MAKVTKKTESRIKIESEDDNGKTKVVFIKLPDSKVNKDAQLIYNKAFREALQDGAILRQKLNSVMREQGVWDDEKQEEYDGVLKQITDKELQIRKGGISLKEARVKALELRDHREEFRSLIAEKSSMDGNTAEGQADNERFSYIVYASLIDEKGHKVFDNFEKYQEADSMPYVIEAAGKLAEKLYGLDPDYDRNLPENKFLVDYSFANEELRLVNDDGHLVDRDGRLISDTGRFIAYDEDGKSYFIDKDGKTVSEGGDYEVEFSPFTDATGEVVPVPGEEKAEEAEEAEEEASEAEAEAEVVVEKPKPKPRKRRTVKPKTTDTE